MARNNNPLTGSVNKIIGENLKQYRQMRHWTLDELSSASSVSKGMLSQIENGNKSPTINILYKICEAMHISVNSLLKTPIPDIEVVHCKPKKEQDSWQIYKLYNYNIQTSMEIEKVYLAPHSEHSANSHGEDVWEYVLVIDGRFTLILDNKTYAIEKGDSLRFRANCAHIYANLTDEPVWIYNMLFYDTAKGR